VDVCIAVENSRLSYLKGAKKLKRELDSFVAHLYGRTLIRGSNQGAFCFVTPEQGGGRIFIAVEASFHQTACREGEGEGSS